MGVDRRKTLEDLEGVRWGKPECDTYLVGMCHCLRQKPLSDFTTEDLRIMIGQGIGLPFLVPLALETLQNTPLASGDYYPGDLLKAVVAIDTKFWSEYSELRNKIREIAQQTITNSRRFVTSGDEDIDADLLEDINNALSKFLSATAPQTE